MKWPLQRRFVRLTARNLLPFRCETRVRGAFRPKLVNNLPPSRWGNADPGAAYHTLLFATSVTNPSARRLLRGRQGPPRDGTKMRTISLTLAVLLSSLAVGCGGAGTNSAEKTGKASSAALCATCC